MVESTGTRIVEALGQSEAFVAFQERVSRTAGIERPVLIVGERGTGKELAATRLHYLSKRWNEPFMALNCATLPATLIEAELFGHEPWAFTGARQRRAGRFESAHGGSLFLDEIGNIPIEAQEKILRVVEYGVFERLGSSEPVRVDVRIIAATNADLPALVRTGKFKPDLLDRLSFEVLFLPPLRARREDVMLLANHFATRMAFELGWADVPEFSAAALGALERHEWPGNIRELKNVVERAVYRSDSARIGVDSIVFDPFPRGGDSAAAGTSPAAAPERPGVAQTGAPPAAADLAGPALEGKPFRQAVREVEVFLLRRALVEARYNQRRAARRLALSYDQFRGLYRKYAGEVGAANDE